MLPMTSVYVMFVLPFSFFQHSELYLTIRSTQVMRLGSSQAGSDSLLTSSTFFKMREIYFHDKIDDEQFNGTLYGLGSSYVNGSLVQDSDRIGAATAAERDRGPAISTPRQQQQQQVQIQTPGMQGPPGLSNGMTSAGLGGAFSGPLGTPFGGLAGNPFVRSAMGTVGGDR